MPRKNMFTREQIVSSALELVREQGMEALTARGLGEKLGASSKPIFSWFRSMEQVQAAVMEAADQVYQTYLKSGMQEGKYPPFKAAGMAYIRFAKEEKQLFRLLFMRDRSHEPHQEKEGAEVAALMTELVQKNAGLNEQSARMLYLENWIYVHGIASMIATGYLEFDEADISAMMTDVYRGLTLRAREVKKNGCR